MAGRCQEAGFGLVRRFGLGLGSLQLGLGLRNLGVAGRQALLQGLLLLPAGRQGAQGAVNQPGGEGQ